MDSYRSVPKLAFCPSFLLKLVSSPGSDKTEAAALRACDGPGKGAEFGRTALRDDWLSND